MTDLTLYNTLMGRKEKFTPLDADNVRMYVCGPTVYDRPHIGNARAVVVYDVLFRLLKHLYPKVTYARNITDVDDKINAAAKANGEPISALTQRVTQWFHDDMDALGNLRPTIEPRATEEIAPIIALIEKIIANGCAYVAGGEVLFEVGKVGQLDEYFYGKLSGKKLEDLIAGARIGKKDHKRNPGDFVLWKPANPGDDLSSVFDSPWGAGRPGWHIECSAMSSKYLQDFRKSEDDPARYDFDIHGGGADLKFPHHENEIAQSLCGNPGSHFAHTWVHNGFVTVNGEKMSKSLGNFITVKDLLDKEVKGEVIRYALLSAKYNEPLDWTERRLEEAEKALEKLYRTVRILKEDDGSYIAVPYNHVKVLLPDDFLQTLTNDFNTYESLMYLHRQVIKIGKARSEESKLHERRILVECGKFLGFFEQNLNESHHWTKESREFHAKLANVVKTALDDTYINEQIALRTTAKKAKNFAEADRIREELAAQGIILEDSAQGTTWRKA